MGKIPGRRAPFHKNTTAAAVFLHCRGCFYGSFITSSVSGFPPAGRAAGQYKTCGGHRKADLVGTHRTAEPGFYGTAQHIGEHGGSQSGGVGVDEEKQGFFRQESGAELHQGEDGILDLPDLALGTAAVGGRVHDDGVIMVAPAELPLHEFSRSHPRSSVWGRSASPEDWAFSLAQATMPLEASTWVTLAPALAAARVAPPVYANRFRTLTGRLASRILAPNQSQLAAGLKITLTSRRKKLLQLCSSLFNWIFII